MPYSVAKMLIVVIVIAYKKGFPTYFYFFVYRYWAERVMSY